MSEGRSVRDEVVVDRRDRTIGDRFCPQTSVLVVPVGPPEDAA